MQGKRYSYAQAHLLDGDKDSNVEYDLLIGIIMTQLSLKAALKEWGLEAHEAALKEMKQLHFRNTFKPVHWKDLTIEQCNMVLESQGSVVVS